MPVPPSPYTAEFLDGQRQRLVAERDRLREAVRSVEEELRSWSGTEGAGVDQHPADDAMALTEQEMDVTLIENTRYLLGEIEDALSRLEAGAYGWDEDGECWIREERLEALPWARFEIAGQRRLEERVKYRDTGYGHDPDMTSL